MNAVNIARTPFIALRHARIGRVGEQGLLPASWRAEHAEHFEVVDVHSPTPPWITITFDFAADIPGQYAGFSLGDYLPAPPSARVAITGAYSFEGWSNVELAVVLLREWRPGGAMVGQSAQSISIDGAQQFRTVVHRFSDEGGLAQPVFLVKRQSPGPGSASVTLRGLAFGLVDEYPGWLEAATGR